MDGMMESDQVQGSSVLSIIDGSLTTIVLNRPHVLNSLNLDMIRLTQKALQQAGSSGTCKCVLLCGAGDRAFCAGGDVKILADWVRLGDFASAERFFEEEYVLDLAIHEFPKPLLVIADGITMGGGLGLAAGADLVIATERSRMAMPETGIGFFPDVGATRWLFDKCPKGYAEFLGLTGHEIKGADTIHCGLANRLLPSKAIEKFIDALKAMLKPASETRRDTLSKIHALVAQYSPAAGTLKKNRADWVEKHFANKDSIRDIVTSLENGISREPFCRHILKTLMSRSPTSLAMTLSLFHANKKRPLKEVFQAEQKAAAFMIRHPDYLEGVRAQIIQKDHRPKWQPMTRDAISVFPDFLR